MNTRNTMIHNIHIENYALIRQTDIDLDAGFVAITGETGAGKSILLGALSLLLGSRADTKVLSDPNRKCVVEAQFNIDNIDLRQLFIDNDLDYNNDNTLLIRREILPSAKSRAFVNDTPVPLPLLKQIGTLLVDIHSQHATLLLAESSFQTSLIDCIAGEAETLHSYQAAYHAYTQLKLELEQLTAQDVKNRKDYDYNQFLFDELQQAALAEGQQEELEQESSLLSNAEEIKQSLAQIAALCDGDDTSALSLLNMCKSQLSKISSLNPQLVSLHERLESSIIELRDIVATVENLNDDITYSPERQQEVDQKLDLIYRLEKKHGVDSIAQLLEIETQLDNQLSGIDLNTERIRQVMESVDKAYTEMQHHAEQLTRIRTEAARKLSTDITPLLADLGMPEATLQASVETTNGYGPLGNNSITLLFNANKGGTLRPLNKVASGGEMSRLMLAIKALTARKALLPTIIFDEIDTGISGDISVKVGSIMQRMAQSMQVIAITHMPQIAARASQHLKVYKDSDDHLTTSKIRQLDPAQRRYEIAVMLSSDPPSQAALQTASELMAPKQ